LKKNFLEIGCTGYPKEQNFAEVLGLAKGKKFYRKTEFLGTWKILQKMFFLRKNLWELLDARVLHIF
jgi:hypothetical protein